LVVSKPVEFKTEISIRKFMHECKKITDARLKNKLTGKEIRIRANSTPLVLEILRKLNLLS